MQTATPIWNHGTYAECERRVRGALPGAHDDDIAAVAQRHYKTGESVWHATHVALQTDRCNCVACARGLPAVPPGYVAG